MNAVRRGKEPHRIIPALGRFYDALSPYAYSLILLVAGASLVPHGWGKIIEGVVGNTAHLMASLGFEPAWPSPGMSGC